MTALILMVISLALLAGFLLLARREQRRGKRYLEPMRARLDTAVEQTSETLKDMDLEYTVRTKTKTGVERALHDIAHFSLIAVRWIERTLTRAVRTLRARRAAQVTDSPASPFATTMKDFGQELREGGEGSNGNK